MNSNIDEADLGVAKNRQDLDEYMKEVQKEKEIKAYHERHKLREAEEAAEARKKKILDIVEAALLGVMLVLHIVLSVFQHDYTGVYVAVTNFCNIIIGSTTISNVST